MHSEQGVLVEPEIIDVEEITPGVSLVPAPRAGVMTAALAMSPAEAKAQADQLREIQAAVLRPEVDYGVIPGTNKPSLYKPGAEWLLKAFGMGHRFEMLDIERDDAGKGFGVMYRCNITRHTEDGVETIIASCDGYASRDEGKWKKSPWNTIIKMAQKRALVGAALQATGTSGLFTQDIEDEQRGGATDEWRSAAVAQLSRFLDSITPTAVDAVRKWWKGERFPKLDDLEGWQAVQVAFEAGMQSVLADASEAD